LGGRGPPLPSWSGPRSGPLPPSRPGTAARRSRRYSKQGNVKGRRTSSAGCQYLQRIDLPYAGFPGMHHINVAIANRLTLKAVGHQVQAAWICIVSTFGMPVARACSASTLRFASRSTLQVFGIDGRRPGFVVHRLLACRLPGLAAYKFCKLPAGQR
jgi:hypothetical protein